MNRKALLTSLLFFGFILITSIGFSQEYPQTSIDPWTTRAGQKSTYYKMVDWDSSPYKEYTFLKRTGPNDWEITEYLNFRMLYPKGYETSNDNRTYPLIILLHGAGESGIVWTDHFDYANGYEETPPEPEKIENNDHQLLYGGKEFLTARNRPEEDNKAFNGFFVFPQVPYNGSWASAFDGPISSYNRQVIELIETLIKKHKIDPNRIYLMGLSNGARGVWDLVNRRSDIFAAAISFSGYGSPELMAKPLAHFPLWIFQGGQDLNPAPAATYKLVNALESAGGSPRLTVYEELGHNVWNRAFSEPDFYSWLLSHSKLTIHVYDDETHFTKNKDISVKLGISPGFSNYEWKYNGEVIQNSNSNDFIAEKPGAYQVRFQREDTWTSWSDPVFITSEEEQQLELPIVYRINVGGPAITDQLLDWSMDNDGHPSPYLSNSSAFTAIQQTASFNNYTEAPDSLFQYSRQGSGEEMHYGFPFQGSAEVVLYFAQPLSDENSNAAILNISIEGEVVEEQLNLLEEGGGNALKKLYLVNVSDQNLDIAIESIEGELMLSGIEIRGTNLITGIKEVDEAYDFLAYPNPFNNKLKVVLKGNELTAEAIIIRDLSGKIVFKEKWEQQYGKEFHLNSTAELSSGFYFLEVNFKNEKRKVLKIVKL